MNKLTGNCGLPYGIHFRTAADIIKLSKGNGHQLQLYNAITGAVSHCNSITSLLLLNVTKGVDFELRFQPEMLALANEITLYLQGNVK